MRVALSVIDAPVPGWTTVRVDQHARNVEAFLDARGADIDELLVVHCVEHLQRSDARALFELIADRVNPETDVVLVAPDARAALAALDDEIVSVSEVAEWSRRVLPMRTDPWCVSAEALTSVALEAGFRRPRPRTLPSGLPPDLEHWFVCLGTGTGSGDRGESPTEPVEVQRRLVELTIAHELEQEEAPGSGALPRPPVSTLRRLLDRHLPSGGRRRAMARAGVDAVRETQEFVDRLRSIAAQSGVHEPATPSYSRWLRDRSTTSSELAEQRRLSESATEPVRVHFVVLAEDGRHRVQKTLRSLQQQTWAHWSATVLGQRWVAGSRDARVSARASNDPLRDVTSAIAALDERDFVVVLGAGDELEPDATFHIADAGSTDPFVDLVYWDDDVQVAGSREQPRLRPSWSPEMLLGANYIGRSFALRRRRFPTLRPELGDDAWWDALLGLDLDDQRVARICRVLAHLKRRIDPVGRHGVELVNAHLSRRAVPATAESGRQCVRIVWDEPPPGLPHVTVIIPTRHNREMLEGSLGSLAATDYPSFDVLVVDNGGRTDERQEWYSERAEDVDLAVHWWSDAFNYSVVNNWAAGRARGEILVFLNDDTVMPEPDWLRELVGWARRPDIGLVGLQLLDAQGRIQHGGVILGLDGFAGHLFEGALPASETLLGPTGWYRNVLSVTGACVAIRRALFEDLGGFDERFRLCGSDVALGLDAVAAGKRNVCSPYGGVQHLESVTRGSYVPTGDYYVSYWRYQRWIFAGDPYFSPGLSVASTVPKLRSRFERTAAERVSEVIGHPIKVFRQTNDEAEVDRLADRCRVTSQDVDAIRAGHLREAAPFDPKTINWFLPELDSPFYGGVNTALRMADHLARVHGVENRFVLWAHPNDGFHRSAISAAFPSLADAPIYYDLSLRAATGIPAADISIATLWVTAYVVANFAETRRRFYLVQDFEPMFYPAGTMYALAEESYRLGLYGICNTENLLDLYERYGGKGMSFWPAVDRSVFHPEGRTERGPGEPVTVFVYARPGHWRNCWEIASLALRELKERLGDRVRIVTAGSWARPDEIGTGIEHLGLLGYAETGALYRSCDVGVALTVSAHPSYLPLELMACGVPVVAFDNPAGRWLLHDGENCLVARRTVSDLGAQLERMVLDPDLRARLASRSLRDIDDSFSSWDKALSGVYEYMVDPEGRSNNVSTQPA